MALNSTSEIIEDIRAGKMVILMDDEDRENEGDLVLAASCVRPEDINFMARYGRGLICLTLTPDHCRRLNLPLMARNIHTDQSTNFTVSIEAAEDITTGISAADRAVTIRKAVAEDARPSDLVQPGHVFPLMAHAGGVLSRAGHTEAGCDLARLAGYQPAAVIVEILNDDGSMARRPDLERFAAEHGLRIGTIADLIHYRIENEKTVERINEMEFPTAHGQFHLHTFKDSVKNDLHFALVKGDVNTDEPVLVRVHLENPVFDLTGSSLYQSSWAIGDALARIAGEDRGVLVILCNQIDQEVLIQRLHELEEDSSEEERSRIHDGRDYRTIGLGSQILSDLGVRKMIVMSSPKRYHALSGFGLEIVDYIYE
jgi:3,4-dihydroxy 2-butanone 4-phosphate synthase/GTP cyclohydrolase II